MDRGHIPQQSLEELLGDSMALEAEQVQRMNQHTHLSWDMEQLSEAASLMLENAASSSGGEPAALDADRKLGDAIQKEKDKVSTWRPSIKCSTSPS
ncbi:hypothetical protein QTO34_005123 [Cnephaeus nilssonii]|uniref:Uncharacterized protein n=1 Tax=Cnephaeus nilssonii TaxID=3371016 RepID=A0AA40LJR4_CNENI|nr:hypothetical protein QTO34_005123 [Eptesicus nilssonii]